MKHYYPYLLILLGCGSLYSCKKTCEFTTEPQAQLYFYHPDSASQLIDTTFDKFFSIETNQEITKTATGEDTSHYYLPLSLNFDTVGFVFVSKDNIDTLIISSKRALNYQGKACGYTINYYNSKVVYHTFKDVLFSRSIENSPEYEIKISF